MATTSMRDTTLLREHQEKAVQNDRSSGQATFGWLR